LIFVNILCLKGQYYKTFWHNYATSGVFPYDFD
jgi:hypothetical protein